MFQNNVIVKLALLFAFTGAAVGSLTLWKITTQSESFLSTTSPKGIYTVRLTGRKDWPKVPFLIKIEGQFSDGTYSTERSRFCFS
jgi:hypothetical protein